MHPFTPVLMGTWLVSSVSYYEQCHNENSCHLSITCSSSNLCPSSHGICIVTSRGDASIFPAKKTEAQRRDTACLGLDVNGQETPRSPPRVWALSHHATWLPASISVGCMNGRNCTVLDSPTLILLLPSRHTPWLPCSFLNLLQDLARGFLLSRSLPPRYPRSHPLCHVFGQTSLS